MSEWDITEPTISNLEVCRDFTFVIKNQQLFWYLSIYLSIYLFIYLSIYLSICLSIYLSINGGFLK